MVCGAALKRTWIALCGGALLLCGCAQMSVRVDVLDPSHAHAIRTALGQQTLLGEACAGDLTRVDRLVSDYVSTYRTALIGLQDVQLKALEGEQRALEAALAELNETMPEDEKTKKLAGDRSAELKQQRSDLEERLEEARNLKDTFRSYGENEFQSEFPGMRDELEEKFHAIGCPPPPPKSCRRSSECVAPVISYENLAALGAFRRSSSAARKEVEQQIVHYRDLLEISPTALMAAVAPPPAGAIAALKVEANEQVDEAQRNLRRVEDRRLSYLGDGKTLAMSKLAHAAVSADERYWAPRYNKAKGFGVGGSTDVAIKLNSTADFSVKGLVFDARATALATRKLTTSAIQLLASGSGLPIKVQGGDDATNETSNVAVDNAAVTAAKTRIAVSEQKDLNYRAAIKRIAASVIAAAQTAQGASTAAERKSARTIASDVFDANKALLSTSSD